MDDACAAFLSRLGKQHQQFLAEANKGLVKTLRQENRRLHEELRGLREALRRVAALNQESPRSPPHPKLLDHPPAGVVIGQGYALPKPLVVEEEELVLGPLVPPGPREAGHGPPAPQPPPVIAPPPVVAHVVWDPNLPGAPDESAPVLPISLMSSNGHAVQPKGSAPDESPSNDMPPIVPIVSRRKDRKISQLAGIVGPLDSGERLASQEDRRRDKTLKRMRDLMSLGYEDSTVFEEDISKALHKRFRSSAAHDKEAAHEFWSEVNRIMGYKEARQSLQLFDLWEVLSRPEFLGEVRDTLQESIARTYRVLMTPTIDEVLDEVARSEAQPEQDPRKQAVRVMLGKKKKRYKWEYPLGVLTSATVLVSMITMGVSMDIAPGADFWVVVETTIASVFVFEMIIKLTAFGPRWYFLSEGCEWNYLDCVITLLSVFDVTMSILQIVLSADGGKGSKLVSGAKMLTVLRILRVARILRLMKLLNSALLKDLANMLSGILIGMPALFWVVVLLALVMFTLGMTFRALLGPAEGQNQVALCGNPDTYADDNPACLLHYMFGEVYFGTVSTSMFTIFRWMMQDYSSKAGINLTLVFSDGYGALFDITFVTGMILIIFGLFNIITAIFVDGTIAGLKYNEVKRKYARMSEYSYVKNALMRLVTRIIEIKMSIDPELAADVSPDMESMETFELTAAQFNFVLRDEGVLKDLENLDVSMYSPAGLMDTFDPQGSGVVTLMAFVKAIMKLRGEPQKSDAIATLLSLQTVQDRLQFLEERLSSLKAPEAGDRFPFG